MNALWLTLAMAAPDLIAFLVGYVPASCCGSIADYTLSRAPHHNDCRSFVVLIGGFAFTGQMLYGSLLEDFRTFEKSFSSLLRFPLGDFDYAKLVRVSGGVAGCRGYDRLIRWCRRGLPLLPLFSRCMLAWCSWCA